MMFFLTKTDGENDLDVNNCGFFELTDINDGGGDDKICCCGSSSSS